MDTKRLFESYENELLPLLFDKEDYLQNNITHLHVRNEVSKVNF